jgi:hypothetical protein
LFSKKFISFSASCSCRFNGTGHTYDLSGLHKEGDIDLGKDTLNNEYWWTPCHNTQKCGGDNGVNASPFCQLDAGGALHSCGTLSSQTWQETSDKNGVILQYTGGQNNRSATVTVQCSTDSSPKVVIPPSENPVRVYHVTIASKYGCPGAHAGGGKVDIGGWIFVGIVLGGFVLYCIVGVIINVAVRGQSGLDIVPQREFWFDLPALVRDGVLFIFNKITGRASYHVV